MGRGWKRPKARASGNLASSPPPRRWARRPGGRQGAAGSKQPRRADCSSPGSPRRAPCTLSAQGCSGQPRPSPRAGHPVPAASPITSGFPYHHSTGWGWGGEPERGGGKGWRGGGTLKLTLRRHHKLFCSLKWL